MQPDPPRAAIYYLISVVFFALASNLTAKLVPNFSAFLMMGLRTLMGGGALWLYVIFFEKTFDLSFLTNWAFWVWSGVFMLALLFYGIAFTTQALEGVFLIVATMPVFVILIDSALDRSALETRLIPPILVMFGAAFLGAIYSLYTAKDATPPYVLLAAATATLCHAVWVVWGRSLQVQTPLATPAARASVMFTAAGILLGLTSTPDFMRRLEQELRGPIFKTNFMHYATEADWVYLLMAGAFSAMTVLMVIHALRRDRASNVIPYHYTFGIWGLVLGLPKRTEWGFELIVPTGAALIIAGSSIWLYRRRVA